MWEHYQRVKLENLTLLIHWQWLLYHINEIIIKVVIEYNVAEDIENEKGLYFHKMIFKNKN